MADESGHLALHWTLDFAVDGALFSYLYSCCTLIPYLHEMVVGEWCGLAAPAAKCKLQVRSTIACVISPLGGFGFSWFEKVRGKKINIFRNIGNEIRGMHEVEQLSFQV